MKKKKNMMRKGVLTNISKLQSLEKKGREKERVEQKRRAIRVQDIQCEADETPNT